MRRRALFEETGEEEGFGRGYRPVEVDLDITPMIDVVFLLLIFFMVTSTMAGTPDVEVPPARYGVGVDKAGVLVVEMLAGGEANEAPMLRLEGGGEATMDDIREAVTEAVRVGRPRVVIRADRDVPNGQVQDILEQISVVAGAEIYIEVRDKTSG